MRRIWFGARFTLRNRDVGGEKWIDDLKSRQGYNYRMPEGVDFSFAGSMQPIVVAGKVFVGDTQGKVYAISLDDGYRRLLLAGSSRVDDRGLRRGQVARRDGQVAPGQPGAGYGYGLQGIGTRHT